MHQLQDLHTSDPETLKPSFPQLGVKVVRVVVVKVVMVKVARVKGQGSRNSETLQPYQAPAHHISMPQNTRKESMSEMTTTSTSMGTRHVGWPWEEHMSITNCEAGVHASTSTLVRMRQPGRAEATVYAS